jgi:hypothetical protein
VSERSVSRKTNARPKNVGRLAAWTGACSGAVFRFARRKPVAVIASVAIVGGAGVFAWNATMHQTSRHPAPLFAPGKTAAKVETPKRPEPASPQTTGNIPTPPARANAGPDAIGSIIRTADAPVRSPEKVVEAKKTEPKLAETKKASEPKPRAADAKPMAETRKPEEPKKRADAKPSAEPKIASAQKALVKLGYGPITSDGILGSGTRQALEKFERDKKLPVTGGLGPRTAKQLASLSGISVQ